MLYDAQGREITEGSEKERRRALAERLVHWEYTDRLESDESRALTPVKLDAIFRDANSGDTAAQARLALEIEEKDWDTAQALQTRRAAVTGLEWDALPGQEDDAAAQGIAEEAAAMLADIAGDEEEPDLDFEGLIGHMLTALLPGYSCDEILWDPASGGKAILGFAPVLTSAITFRQSQEPLISTRTNTAGDPLVPHKFVFHKHLARSGDTARGGLIRPLGWMYLFENLGVKDLMRFVEKFGMPFVSARIDENAWETDRTQIAYLIRNFGSDGGAVFSKAVELEMLEGMRSTGEVYFKLLQYFGDAKTKVVLGQTATSGDAGGFSQGQAQAAVRQDILEADCAAIERTIRKAVLTPWTMFVHGPDAPVPYLSINCKPPADLAADATVMKTLYEGGLEVDPAFATERFGMPLTRRAEPGGAMAFRAESDVDFSGVKKKQLSQPGRSMRRMNRW
jgi:phage gp29-like protein